MSNVTRAAALAAYSHLVRRLEPAGREGHPCAEHFATLRAFIEAAPEKGGEKPTAIVRSVAAKGENGVRIRWLRGFPQIGTKLYAHPAAAKEPGA